jgi:predicted phosphate transport protein (TIGR00153 family)
MLTTILSLFARSPFAPLAVHMDRVHQCVHQLTPLFDAIEKGDTETQEQIVKAISELEHYADITKNEIRNHLPKGIFLPIGQPYLLEILSLQDAIADAAQDVAILTSLKPIRMLDSFRTPFREFLDKNLEAFDHACLIVKEIHELLESAFGGVEAEKVRNMVHQVAYKEHEVDLIQRKLLKHLFDSEDELSVSSFIQWDKIFKHVGAISNLSEKLGNRIRMTLELK